MTDSYTLCVFLMLCSLIPVRKEFMISILEVTCVYTHIHTGTACLVLSKCSINIYGMNYSSNRDLYNFTYLTYLYIYTKKCLYCTFMCEHMNDRDIAPLGFVEYGRNFSLL